MYKYFAFVIIIFSLILASCEKQDDYNKLLLDYQYQGSFSLPLGDTILTIKNNGINLPSNWQTDTIFEKLDSIELHQKITFDFIGSVSSVDYIGRLILRVISTNEFPAEAHFNLYFADSLNALIDSLPNEKIIILPSYNDSLGRVIDHGYNIQDFEVINEHYIKWTNVKSIILNGYILKNTKYRNLYKYYQNYKLKIIMAVRIDFDHVFHRKIF
jgi:hypothetical protein